MDRRESQWGRRLGVALAVLFAAIGVAAVALHELPAVQFTSPATAAAAAAVPLGVLAWLASAVLFLWVSRRWGKLLALPALAGLVLQVTWTAPYWPGPTPDVLDDAVTVASINLRCDGESLSALAEQVGRHQPDILVLQGADTYTLERLADEAWLGEGAHVLSWPGSAAPGCGTVVASLAPLEDLTADLAQPVVRVALGNGELVVVPVDVPSPLQGVAEWREAIARAYEAATPYLDQGALAIGDFNATREHLPLRDLLDAGFADATEQSNSGWLPTFPPARGLPPLLTIDHALVSEPIRALSVETFQAGRNPHLGLVVTLAWTSAPGDALASGAAIPAALR